MKIPHLGYCKAEVVSYMSANYAAHVKETLNKTYPEVLEYPYLIKFVNSLPASSASVNPLCASSRLSFLFASWPQNWNYP